MRNLLGLLLTALLIVSFLPGCSESTTRGHGVIGQAARSKPFVGRQDRRTYHKPDCELMKNVPDADLIGWDTAEAAQADGRQACKMCNP